TGQLVSASEYSMVELIRRWLWRHRLAVTSGLFFITTLSGVGLYSARRVIRERDRAEARSNELLLLQAQKSLDSDPTAAIAWLKMYPEKGVDASRARTIASDAVSRGIALHAFSARTAQEPIAFSSDGHRFAFQDAQGIIE